MYCGKLIKTHFHYQRAVLNHSVATCCFKQRFQPPSRRVHFWDGFCPVQYLFSSLFLGQRIIYILI